jgi:hypothetical protein
MVRRFGEILRVGFSASFNLIRAFRYRIGVLSFLDEGTLSKRNGLIRDIFEKLTLLVDSVLNTQNDVVCV